MAAPLDSFDLATKLFSAVVLPLIVYLNIRQRSNPSTPFAAYLWKHEETLTVVALVFLSVLAAFSMLDLAVHFGIVSAAFSEPMLPVVGIPMAVLAIAVLVLAARAGYRVWRART